jgi:lysyl-tRNA synthetase class 1
MESLLQYLFQNPRRAKRLYWDIVPKSVDDHLDELRRYPTTPEQKQPDLASWHIFNQGESVPAYQANINFSLVNNLVSALGTDQADLTIEYLKRYDPAAAEYEATIKDLVSKSINYYRDFILPEKMYRPPTDKEQAMLQALRDQLAAATAEDETDLQTIPFEIARHFEVPPAEIFQAFYQVVLGQARGPRFGTFAKLVGKERMVWLLDNALTAQPTP